MRPQMVTKCGKPMSAGWHRSERAPFEKVRRSPRGPISAFANKTLPSRVISSGTGYGSRRNPILSVRQWGRCPQRELRLIMHADASGLDHSRLAPTRGERPGILPVASPFEPSLSGGALVLGLVVLATILAGRGPERDIRTVAEAARPGRFRLAQTIRQMPRSSAFF